MELKALLRGLDRFNYVLMALSAFFLTGIMAGATSFSVRNATAETIEFTPVAAWHPDWRRAPVPLVISDNILLPAWQYGRFALGPGESITLRYDWDNCQLSEIVVYAGAGRPRVLTTRAELGGLPVVAEVNGAYQVSNVDELPEVRPPALDGATAAEGRAWPGTLLFYSFVFGPWVAFVLFRIFLRGPYISRAEREVWELWAAKEETVN